MVILKKLDVSEIEESELESFLELHIQPFGTFIEIPRFSSLQIVDTVDEVTLGEREVNVDLGLSFVYFFDP